MLPFYQNHKKGLEIVFNFYNKDKNKLKMFATSYVIIW